MRKGMLVLAACGCMTVVASAMAEVVLEQTQPLQPVRIAQILASGERGPWINYVAPDIQPVGDYGVLWDNYEADPTLWNNTDNVPCEYYDQGGLYCLGPCDGRRYRWCALDCGGGPTDWARSHAAASGGDVAGSPPANIDVLSLIWGHRDAAEGHVIEVTVYDTYNGTDCNDGGTNLTGGVALDFGSPAQGFYRTTADLEAFGLSIPSPGTGRIGINSRHYSNYDNGTFSDRGFNGLWVTKTGYEAQMGKSDLNGYEDFFYNNNGELEEGECVVSGPVCPDGDTLTGPAYLLLGRGGGGGPCEGDGCNGNERLKASAKDKNGDCLVKAKVTDATPGAVYGIIMPSGECAQRAANSRGIAKAKEKPSVSGTVEVPTCGLSKAVVCP